MISVKGYFDGNVCIPLEAIQAETNQRVIITVLDKDDTEINQDPDIAMKIFATLSSDDAQKIREEKFKIKDC